MQDYLTDLEVEKIELFCKDQEMYEAVKKVILKGIYTDGTIQKGFTPNPLENAAFNLASLSIENPIPNEQLGENIRGMWAGVNYLHNGFKTLKNIKKTEVLIESPYNEAI